jgi:Zn-dependent protease
MDNRNEKGRQKGKWKTWSGIVAALAVIGGKLKFLLPLLKFGKVGATVWSMLLTAWAYALIYPWTFAVGLVLMIFIHETGHLLAAKQRGLPVSAPMFIPFMGALIAMKKHPQDAETEAYIAFGGPLLGTLGAVAAFALGAVTHLPLFYSIAWVGFFLNLLNMLPIHPLDGGRIVIAISRWLWLVGLVAGLIVIVFYLRSVIFFMIWLLFAVRLYSSYRSMKKNEAVQSVVLNRDLVVPLERFELNGVYVPGETHRRHLAFSQYSRLTDRRHVCAVEYPGIGQIGEVEVPEGLVTAVEMSSALVHEEGEVRLRLEVSMVLERPPSLLENGAYYQVPVRTRWMYGLAYLGLALFLSVFIWGTSQLLMRNAALPISM